MGREDGMKAGRDGEPQGGGRAGGRTEMRLDGSHSVPLLVRSELPVHLARLERWVNDNLGVWRFLAHNVVRRGVRPHAVSVVHHKDLGLVRLQPLAEPPLLARIHPPLAPRHPDLHCGTVCLHFHDEKTMQTPDVLHRLGSQIHVTVPMAAAVGRRWRPGVCIAKMRGVLTGARRARP